MKITIENTEYVRIADDQGQLVNIPLAELVAWLHRSGLCACLPTADPGQPQSYLRGWELN